MEEIMAFLQLGSIIKWRREELHYSQEELADGICSVPTLSRIENGERLPTKNHFEMLMQRLGYSTESPDFYIDKNDFLLHELKYKIRQAYIEQNIVLSKKYLEEYKYMLVNKTQIDQQFLILYETLLYEERYQKYDLLERFERALRLTCPGYNDKKLPRVLSYEEIIILNNIAIECDYNGNRIRSISILQSLREYYAHQIICTDEALRTQPMILYNLSKYLGLEGQYDECIDVCNNAIRIAKTSGRCSYLGRTLYNRGWALLKRNEYGDFDLARITIRHSYHISSILNEKEVTECCRQLWDQYFPNEILL